MDGAWYLLTVRPLPVERRNYDAGDVALSCPVATLTLKKAEKFYGARAYATAKRRLAQRELRNYPIPVDAWR